MTMTLKKLSEYPVLETETLVKVKVGDDIFQGKIVGQGATCPNPLFWSNAQTVLFPMIHTHTKCV